MLLKSWVWGQDYTHKQHWRGRTGKGSTKPDHQWHPGGLDMLRSLGRHSWVRVDLSPLSDGEQLKGVCRGGARASTAHGAWPLRSPAELRALESWLSKTKADVNREPASPSNCQRHAEPRNFMSLQSTRLGRREHPLPRQHSAHGERPRVTFPLWDAPGLFLCPGVYPFTCATSKATSQLSTPQSRGTQGDQSLGKEGKMLSQDTGDPRGGGRPWEQETPELCHSVLHLPLVSAVWGS